MKMLKFVLEEEAKSQEKSEMVARLEAQVNALRHELAQAQRQLAQYEALLQNAQLREQELRLQLFRGK